MGLPRYIWMRGKRYYKYDTYDHWSDAASEAKYHKRLFKSKYKIIKWEAGTIFPREKYTLYMTKTVTL